MSLLLIISMVSCNYLPRTAKKITQEQKTDGTVVTTTTTVPVQQTEPMDAFDVAEMEIAKSFRDE